jgi:hypothetical protein
MSKVIGIVSEGPTDYLVLKAVIDRITGETNRYLHLQPEQDMLGQFGNGWKGVWRWCKETDSVNLLMKGIQPQIDAIVIQMDGDVVRKEKEVHCLCDSTVCEIKGEAFPLYCDKKGRECPVELPCKDHENEVLGIMEHVEEILSSALKAEDISQIAITIPCDSTDAWVVAAYDDMDDVEKYEDPWRTIIAKKKEYHGIRVRGDKKNVNTYKTFSNKVAESWDVVTQKCTSAARLDNEVKRVMGI